MRESLDDMIDRVQTLIRTDDPTALDEAHRLGEEYPEAGQTRTVLHFAYSRDKNLEGEIAALTQALEITPAQPDLMFERGVNEAKRGNFEAALANFTQALVLYNELDPDKDLEMVHFFRADALLCLDRPEEARAALEHVSDGYTMWMTNFCTKREMLAACNGKHFNWEEEAKVGSLEDRMEAIRIGARPGTPKAVEVATRLTEEFPNVAKVWHLLHDAHWLNEDIAAAASVMQKAIDLEPREPTWHFYRADAKALLGDFAAAVADLTEAIRVCDPEAQATLLQKLYFWRADMFLLLGRKAEARADLERAPDIFALRTTRIRTQEEMLAECDA